MTLEERADKLFDEVFDCFGIEGEVHGPVLSVQVNRLHDIIESAIRAAENDLIDKAIRMMFAIGEDHGVDGADFFASAVLGPLKHKESQA